MFGLISEIRLDIDRVREVDPAARGFWDVLLFYPGMHAVWLHRITHFLWMRGFKFIARFIAFLVRGWTGVEIHPGALIGKRVVIDHGMGVVIGESAIVGDECLIYHGVTLGAVQFSKGKRHPTIGKSVILGAGCKIIGNVSVPDGKVVAANKVIVAEE
jgi:serine O-acetyltransferase